MLEQKFNLNNEKANFWILNSTANSDIKNNTDLYHKY